MGDWVLLKKTFFFRTSHLFKLILGDPGADSGGEGKLNGRKNMTRRKVKNGKKSPWGQRLTTPVPNSRRRSGF